MSVLRVLIRSALLAFVLALVACGSGGGAGQPPPGVATVSTFAYVVNECRVDSAGSGTMRQQLQIRQGNQAPITVWDTGAVGFTSNLYCLQLGYFRATYEFSTIGVFQRLGVTPDGSHVVFEVSDDHEGTLFPLHTLLEDQKGIFIVRADGTGKQRLGDASREPVGFGVKDSRPHFAFSPNGHLIAYTDRGPSRTNEDAVQIFTLDLFDPKATPNQVTQLPPTVPDGTWGPFFNDDQTITFFTSANLDCQNHDRKLIVATVKTTDSTHTLTCAPQPIAIPGSEVLTGFRITGSEVNVAPLLIPTPGVSGGLAQEVFVIDRDNNVLQLTNFHHNDTASPTLSADGQRVVFCSSANPKKTNTNPLNNCQLFSIDRDGVDLRQLTNFQEEGLPSKNGCFDGAPPGCFAYEMSRDVLSDALVFESSCDPFGMKAYGAELFAMRADGTGLNQLTKTQGYKRTNGTWTVEMVYPWAFPGLEILYSLASQLPAG